MKAITQTRIALTVCAALMAFQIFVMAATTPVDLQPSKDGVDADAIGTGLSDKVSQEAFIDPPLDARPGAFWCWLNGYVDHEQITREMEEARSLGMRGFDLWDVGVIKDEGTVPHGPAFLGEESLKSIKHAMTEANRLGLELNMIGASSWNAGGAWVKKSDGVKRMASSSVDVSGPKKFDAVLSLPCDSETYYYDISVLAVPQSKEKKCQPPYHPMKAPSITSPKKQIPSSHAILQLNLLLAD